MALVFQSIHKGHAVALIGRQEAVHVTELHYLFDPVVIAHGQTAIGLFVVGHLPGLQVHTEFGRCGYVETELQRYRPAGDVVGTYRNMACHTNGGEELAGSPLYLDAVECIGIVANPELVEIGQCTVIDASPTTGTCHDGDVGILLPYTLEYRI